MVMGKAVNFLEEEDRSPPLSFLAKRSGNPEIDNRKG
jgi:hypothetical protein